MVFLLLLVYAGYLLILRRLVEILWSQLHHVNVDSLFFRALGSARHRVFSGSTHSRIPVVSVFSVIAKKDWISPSGLS